MKRFSVAVVTLAVVACLAPAHAQAPREVEYWSATLSVSGQARQNASASFNRGALNINTGNSQAVSGTARSRLWIDEAGALRWRVDDCTYLLSPETSNVSFETGGLFVASQGVGRACDTPGEITQREIIRISHIGENLSLEYRRVYTFTRPFAGRADVSGTAVHTPTYRRPAPQTATAVAPVRRAMTQLDAALDELVSEDSRSWMFWRYDHGSMHSAVVEERSGANLVMLGRYTYNGGSPGWVRVRLAGENVECIEFWNEARCRPLGRPTSHAIVGALMLGAVAGAAGAVSGAGAPSSSYDSDQRLRQYQNEAGDAAQRRYDQQPR